ncbi:hypothetical protein [Pontibacter flavimaris]|uniref:Lipoprotein n=1 Tax=Pontibacter flavimaris TaxID=1797110 RepID=A0A1Q5PIT7_9BACT|nr:hypothetical protein [Pontibacter flavimaris]OKL42112.1 hypothetical protein A3841_08960 [Pontibacter flavimaris]
MSFAMRYTLSVLGLLLLLTSCGPDGKPGILGRLRVDSLEAVQEEPQPASQPADPDTAAFADAFNQFFSALQAGDTAALNRFVEADQGLWLIEQPGAMPAYSHFTSIQQVQREYQQRPFTSINQEVKACQLEHRDTFPGFDCADMDGGSTGFAEDGCFYTFKTANFQHTDMWQYADLSEQQAQQVQELQQQVQATVLHTGTSYRFHFGYRNGRWLLLFADLRVPCSA